MSISKKDFIVIADELRDALQQNRGGQNLEGAVVDSLCRAFSRLNPNFKQTRWVSYLNGECGPSGGAVKGGR